MDSLEGPLLQVEGLSDLRLELHSKKLNIHVVLIDELHRHLYIKSTSRVGHRAKDKEKGRYVSMQYIPFYVPNDTSWEKLVNAIELSFFSFT